ncbi:hypothetical protein Dtox_2944 [Desulfofarcimen acetoxidans DSM 771]|uniref:Uncharacterized protein n=1 Tax=Desulfofarcimen acetoxidans (strain ATCC 49208 / DSM 771 / KCTC 5769 / VKM B-1644 / 5575) TaxID=485916 RepID=C8W2L5_DESAS|nr:hypothetical protein [Desulfofarcimen acetoxidans]ACV63699.1 hypothetical protein Dtox_2944 [Desulfofarcimen acetoxidans DSM 771]
MIKSPRLNITEKEPVSLIRDFSIFTDYLKANRISLAEVNSYISKTDLYQLNLLMTKPEILSTEKLVRVYPLLNFFYHLVLSGRLFVKVTAKDGKKVLEPDQRLKLYEALTVTEKYFFLLETFWTDINWINAGKCLLKDMNSIFDVPVIVAYISGMRPGQTIILKKTDHLSIEYLFSKLSYINLYLSYLGLLDVIPDERMINGVNSRVFYPFSISANAFGIHMADILTKYRHIPLWNLPFRRWNGEYKAVPGTPLPEDLRYREMLLIIKEMVFYKDRSKILVPPRQTKLSEPFFLPFKNMFASDELQKTLPRLENNFHEGTYVFKIFLNPSLAT